MTHVTLTLAFIGCLLVLFLKPPQSFAVLITIVLWYPRFLVISIGSVYFSLFRIVVLVMLMRCILNKNIRRRFSVCLVDKWVFLSAIVSIVIPFITWHSPLETILINRAGYVFDTFLAYLVARFCIVDRESLLCAVKWLCLPLAVLAMLGVIECLTDWQPFIDLKKYRPWPVPGTGIAEGRFGLTRAVGASSHPIMFGFLFVIFIPFIYLLRYENAPWNWLAKVLVLIAGIGVLSSMSSGPWIMLFLMVFCFAMEKFKSYVKPIIIFFILGCIIVGIISNRPFYHVLVSYINPISGGGWHRAKLIDCAIESFNEWWMLGYGGRDPGWGPSLGMTWTDITNQYLNEAVLYGLVGIISFLGIMLSCFKIITLKYKESTRYNNVTMKSFCWSLGSLVITLLVGFNSINLLGDGLTLFMCVMGMACSVDKTIVQNKAI